MTDVETRLRAGLGAFADDLDAGLSPPPVAEIVMRATAAPVRSPRRWKKLAVAVAASTAITAGAAAATGLLPAPVESVLAEFRSWGFGATQGAERMATTTNGQISYEVWRAPLEGGGTCVYVRVVGPQGDISHGGASQCGAALPARSRDRFVALAYPEVVRGSGAGADPEPTPAATAEGQAPSGTTKIIVEFDTNPPLSIEPQRDGFFITTFPGVRSDARITHISAVDAQGNILATQ